MFKRHKYNANKTVVDWIKFDSKLESRFYKYFKENNIEIIELQPKFILQDKFIYNWKSIRAIKYIADFKIKYNWNIYFIDSKWMIDNVFKIKYKLWVYKYWKDYDLIIAKSIKDLFNQIENF